MQGLGLNYIALIASANRNDKSSRLVNECQPDSRSTQILGIFSAALV